MTLLKVVQELDVLDQEDTIYAEKPWTINSKAMVLREPESGKLPSEAENLNLKYFLEVFVANDFIKEWNDSLNNVTTLQQKYLRLIQYAINDA